MRAALQAARRRRGAGRVGAGEGAAVGSTRGIDGAARHGVHGDAVGKVLARVGSNGSGRARGRTLAVTYATDELLHHLPACVVSGVERLCVGAGPLSARAAARFKRAGVQVRRGVEGARAMALHRDIDFLAARGRPWVTLKAAVSVDGMMACANGQSQWITGGASRREGHRLRATHDAIAVGAGTVRSDNPRLTVRAVPGVDPRVVVFDSRLALAAGRSPFHVFRPGTVVVHGAAASTAARARATKAGLSLLCVRTDRSGRLDVRHALQGLGDLQVRSLMVEGGGALLASLYASGAWEEFHLFCAPKILGGAARPLLPGLSWAAVERAPAVRVVGRRLFGEDTRTVLAPRKS